MNWKIYSEEKPKLFKRGKGKNPDEAVFTCLYANASSERVIFPLSCEVTLQEAFNDMKDHVLRENREG